MEIKDVARSRFSPAGYAAWVAMGERVCSVCGQPMAPCPKGPGADEPGFVGYYPCCPGGEPVASPEPNPPVRYAEITAAGDSERTFVPIQGDGPILTEPFDLIPPRRR